MQVFGYDIKIKKAKRAYEAADKGRRTKSYRMAKSTGANREVSGALVTLRDRSRHMVRNNGWSKRAVEAITKHTVGEGIRPAPDCKLAELDYIKKIWKKWAETTACDWYGKTTFYGLQELAMRAIVEGGDVLILKRWCKTTRKNAIPLKLHLLEGDHLDHTRNGENDKGTARLGVQFDKQGRRIGYWIFDHHPGDTTFFTKITESKFYPDEDVLHAFEVLRIGQVRGLPFGVAAFMKMQDFSDYEDAQLVKQKIAACFTAFVRGDGESANENEDDEQSERMEPGLIQYLDNTEGVEFANPPTVGDYDPYASRILQGVAAAYGITYEMLTMDYSKVNFTSGRMAKIDVTQNFRSWQYNMMVPQVCQPVWEWFTDACLVAGLLFAPVDADWTAPRVQQLDPVKEVGAQVTSVENGLATISEIIRETGRDPEEFFKEYQQDIERLNRMGISIKSLINTLKNNGEKSD